MVQKQAAREPRRQRTRVEADRLAAEYEVSGLTRGAFSRERNIPLKTLCRYVTQYRRQKAGTMQPPRFVQVEVTTPSSNSNPLTVVLCGGRRIEVSHGFDAGTLRQLVIVLEQA